MPDKETVLAECDNAKDASEIISKFSKYLSSCDDNEAESIHGAILSALEMLQKSTIKLTELLTARVSTDSADGSAFADGELDYVKGKE